MLDWLQDKIGQRSSHPMNSPAEAARLLTELPLDEPLKAVEEVAAWLESLAHATSFGTESRLKVISMVDEAGQPCAELLMTEYLAGEAKHSPGRFKQWQVLMDFWERLADAYQLIALQIEVSKRSELTEQTALIAVRGMRAVSTQMRLALMRYAGEPERLWKAMYHLYSLAHAQRRAAVPVRPYPWDSVSTTARLELVRAVMLESAGPQSLPPRQIELTARIAARLASSFAYSETPDEHLPIYLDLVQSRAPVVQPAKLQPTATMRFFGTGAAPVRLKDILAGLGSPQPGGERLGDEFTSAEKIEILQRLLLYWSDNPPRRQHNRTRLSNTVDVMFGLQAIKRLVGKVEQSVFQEESDKFKIDLGANEAAQEPTKEDTIETWKLKDISMRGLGAITTRRAHGALKIGALMAFRLENSDKWCVGIVRRLQSDAQNNSHVGSEIFSKDPHLLWLKKLGMKQEEAWNWEKGGQKSLQHMTEVVLLPADNAAAGDASLLFEPETYYAEETFGAMISNRPRRLQVGEVLERGDGFDRLAFKWLAVEAEPPAPKPAPPPASGGFDDNHQD
jgi:plasmid maintenance system antidote protein VapI